MKAGVVCVWGSGGVVSTATASAQQQKEGTKKGTTVVVYSDQTIVWKRKKGSRLMKTWNGYYTTAAHLRKGAQERHGLARVEQDVVSCCKGNKTDPRTNAHPTRTARTYHWLL